MKPFTFFLLSCLVASATGPVDDRVAGSPSAPITIEVFSDFQCPACKVLHEQTLMPLLKDYVATGKVYLIHREFPLPGHAYARLAATYACAAAHLGKYEEIGSLLFRKQSAWSVSGKVDETVCSVLTPAEAKTVRALVKDPAIAAEVQRDFDLALKEGIRQTPTMVVRHRLSEYPISGAVRYDLLRRFLDDQLAK